MNRLSVVISAALFATLVAQLAFVRSRDSEQVRPEVAAPPTQRLNPSVSKGSDVGCPLTIEPAELRKEVYEEVMEIPYTFRVTNRGTTTVRIDAIKPSCSCTIVECDEKSIAPGATISFTAVYDVKTQFGKLATRRIQLVTDHLGCSQLSCAIGGQRNRRFTIDPATVDFGVVRQGQSPSQKVTVKAHGEDLKLLPERIIGTNTDFDLQVIKDYRDEAGDQVLEMVLKIPEDAKIGTMRGRLFVPRREDDGIGPIVDIVAVVAGPVRTVPQSLLFGSVRSQEPRTRSVRLIPTDPQSQELVDNIRIESLPDGFTLQTDAQRDDVIELTFDPRKYRGPETLDQVAVVVCDFGQQQCRLAIPLTGRIRPSEESP